jgi:hypothetical protein
LIRIPRYILATEAALAAGPSYLDDLVLDIAVIPAQKTRDLLYREAAYEHVAQLDQLHIRTFFGGAVGRPVVASVGQMRCQRSSCQSGLTALRVRDFAAR